MSRGSCPTLAARRRRLDLPRDRRHVVDHVGQRSPGAAVDAGMVHLGIEPDLVVLHAFEDIELPQRTGAIEQLGMHPADDALQRGAVVRRRKAAAEDMAVDIELVVLDPGGMIDVERRLFQPRFQDRRDVQPRGDHRLEVFEEVALVILGQAEDRHAPDMHRHFRRFQIQKRRVHRGQLLGVTHMFLPRTAHAAPWRRFWRSDGSVFGTSVRIVPVLEAHMQWQTAPIGQIGGIGPRAGPGGRRPPTGQPGSRRARHGWRGTPRCFRP